MVNPLQVSLTLLHKQVKLIINYLDELENSGVSLTNNIYANAARPKMKALLQELREIENAKDS